MGGRATGGPGEVSPEDRALAAVPLVDAIVDQLAPQLPGVARDDLLSAGLVALLDAANRFEPTADGDFDAYAAALVRSALLLDLRSAPPEAGATPVGALPEPRSAAAWLQTLHATIDDLWTRRMPVEEADDADDDGLAAAQLVRLRAESLMVLRNALAANAEEPDWDDDLIAARQATYAAIADRHALLRAHALEDVEERRRA